MGHVSAHQPSGTELCQLSGGGGTGERLMVRKVQKQKPNNGLLIEGFRGTNLYFKFRVAGMKCESVR